jgi:hypothetical protein
MNLSINTRFLYSETIIKTLFPFSLKICQYNFSDEKFISKRSEEIFDEEIFGSVDLLDKIKEVLKNNTKNNLDVSKINTNIELFNKVCFLYFNGGIIMNGNILIKNIDSILSLYENTYICSIKSCVSGKLFDGIIMSKKGNSLLLEIIESFLNNPTINVSEILLNTIDKNQTIGCRLFNEQIVADKSDIYGTQNEVIAEHYFKNELIVEKFKLINKSPKDLSQLKIGITTNIPPNLKDFYSNGIKQNCMYLYELLKNAGYDVKLVIDSDKHVSVLKEIDFYNFEYVTIYDVFSYDFNLIFSMGFSIPQHIFNGFKNTGVKVVYYMCGNNYLIDSEKILYDQHKTRSINYFNDQHYDQIWIIPQMYNQNKYYAEILQRSKAIQIPFIWSPMSIKFITKMLNLEDDSSLLYKKKDAKIGIFEPNMSVMKWCLPCVLIAENTQRTYGNIKHVYVTNMNKSKESDINHFNMEQFNNACRGLELFKEKKLTVESRYNTLEFMSKHCDIALSHQWENPLNYLYLDLAWMGWPILHNAHLCKDVGYYYEGFNYYEASEMLNHILTNHDANVANYMKKNREVIDVYLPTNKALQEKYRGLIESLFHFHFHL